VRDHDVGHAVEVEVGECELSGARQHRHLQGRVEAEGPVAAEDPDGGAARPGARAHQVAEAVAVEVGQLEGADVVRQRDDISGVAALQRAARAVRDLDGMPVQQRSKIVRGP